VTEVTRLQIGDFLDRLASDAPTPGGGSVCGLVGALAAALGSMVAAISRRREESPKLARCAEAFRAMRDRFLALSAEDEAAFDAVMSDLRRPKDDPERADRLADSLQRAAEVPLHTAAACVELLETLRDALPHATRHVTSDIGAAAHLARAAAHAALLNVSINLSGLRNPQVSASLCARRDRLAAQAEELFADVLPRVVERIG
jgi:formiminotetrahydrofolate cyclodeaminase